LAKSDLTSGPFDQITNASGMEYLTFAPKRTRLKSETSKEILIMADTPKKDAKKPTVVIPKEDVEKAAKLVLDPG